MKHLVAAQAWSAALCKLLKDTFISTWFQLPAAELHKVRKSDGTLRRTPVDGVTPAMAQLACLVYDDLTSTLEKCVYFLVNEHVQSCSVMPS